MDAKHTDDPDEGPSFVESILDLIRTIRTALLGIVPYVFLIILLLGGGVDIYELAFVDQEADNKTIEEAKEIEYIKRRLCNLKQICVYFSQYRQQCATAGNFDNCLKIKLGSDNYDMIDSGNEDGTVRWYSTKPPTAARCFILWMTSPSRGRY